MRNTERQEWIEANMGLVGKVIKTEIHNIDKLGCFTYDDLFQMGCVGLCHAADKLDITGSAQSTYAYACIRNSIFKQLSRSSQYRTNEIPSEYALASDIEHCHYDIADTVDPEPSMLLTLLSVVKTEVSPTTAKGIDALILHNQGYSYREIGEMWSETANHVTAMVSRARTHLKRNPDVLALWHEAI